MDKYVKQIAEDGYCVLRNVYQQDQVKRALILVKAGYEQTRNTQSSAVPFLNRNQPIVYNLQNKDHYFLEMLFSCELLEKLFVRFLNDPWYKQIPTGEPNYIMRSFLARSSKDPLPLHIDSFIPYKGPHVISMQVAILLEESTVANGCTVFVPRSHQAGEYVEQKALRDAIPIEGKPGDAVIWDSRLWHGANAGTSDGTRWAIIATFARWWLKQAFDIPQSLPDAIKEKLSPKEKAIMGFSSRPYGDESEGIDMKRGYE